MRELDAQGNFWLTPARANLIITDQKGIRRDLPSFVASRSAGRIDEWVRVGADKQVSCRLLVFPPDEKARPRKKDQKVRVKGSRDHAALVHHCWLLERSAPQSGQGLSFCAKGRALHHLDDEWASHTARTLSHHVSQYERLYHEYSQETSQYLSAPVRCFWLSS